MNKFASVTRGSRQLYYERREPEVAMANPPVAVYLSSYGTHIGMLEEIIADHNRRGIVTVAVDSYGNGKSGRSVDTADYSLAEHEADLEAILKRERIDKATIIGHSMGAMIALKFAADHSNNVEGLGLVSATYQPKETFEKNALRKITFKLVPIMELIEDFINKAYRITKGERAYYPNFKDDVFKRSDFRIWLELTAKRSRMETEAVRTQGKAVMQYDLREDLGRVSAPTQLIHGSLDFLVPPQTVGYLRRNIPGARDITPVIIDGAGHGVITQKPREVIKALDGLLKQTAYHGRLRPRA